MIQGVIKMLMTDVLFGCTFLIYGLLEEKRGGSGAELPRGPKRHPVALWPPRELSSTPSLIIIRSHDHLR